MVESQESEVSDKEVEFWEAQRALEARHVLRRLTLPSPDSK